MVRFSQIFLYFYIYTCIIFSQAREVEIVTSRAVPVQVDGEPLLMNPFKLRLEYFNSAAMLTKKKTSCEYRI